MTILTEELPNFNSSPLALKAFTKGWVQQEASRVSSNPSGSLGGQITSHWRQDGPAKSCQCLL